MLKKENFKKDKIEYAIWVLLIAVIESFFVFAAMSSSYTLMAILMVASVFLALIYMYFISGIQIEKDFFLISYFLFILYMSIRTLQNCSYVDRNCVDIFFYGLAYIIIVASKKFETPFENKKLWNLLRNLGLFFALGIFLQFIFTDLFMKYYTPLFGEEYQSSIQRQVIEHKMYTGWTSQTFATCLNLIMGIFATWELCKKERKNILWLIILLIAFLLTGKRGPLLFAVVALLASEVLMVEHLKDAITRIIKYTAIILSIMIVLIIFVNIYEMDSRNTIVRFLEMFQNDGDISNGRFILWEYAWKLFCKSPILGIGWRQYRNEALLNINQNMEVHNVYLQILTETGVIGFILYIVPVGYALINTFQCYRKANKLKLNNIQMALKYSFMLQLYLLLYCFTENVLYDYCAQLLYFFSFALYLAAKNRLDINLIEY